MSVVQALRAGDGGRQLRNPTDLRDPGSFDHVGRDQGAKELVAGAVLAELADSDPRIVCATADLTYVTHLGVFARRHPTRMFQFGIAERNMLTAAAGMATCGLVPYVATFASFSAILGYEAIRTDMAYPKLPVRVLATHSGISMGFFGTSHHATEDIAALRAVADLVVLSPPDGAATEALLRATVDEPGPIYFRLGRGRERPLYDEPPEGYGPGAPRVVREGSDVLLISTGIMVRETLDAADALARDGISATVLDVHTLKPFDAAAVAEHAARHPAVLVVEEHNVEGGLGTMVVEAVAATGAAVPVSKHGLYDEYGIVGPPTHLYRYYALDPDGIAVVTRRMLDLVDAGTFWRRAPAPLWGADDKRRILDRYAATPNA